MTYLNGLFSSSIHLQTGDVTEGAVHNLTCCIELELNPTLLPGPSTASLEIFGELRTATARRCGD